MLTLGFDCKSPLSSTKSTFADMDGVDVIFINEDDFFTEQGMIMRGNEPVKDGHPIAT